MPEFNLDGLINYLNNEIQKALETDVGNKIVEIAQEHVQSDVYNVYKPKAYVRTGQLKEDFKINPVSNGIEIENTRSDRGRDIPEVIEYGHDKSEQGYEFPAFYPNGDNFIQPRPFMENTEKQILDENIHVSELKKSLKLKGLEVE